MGKVMVIDISKCNGCYNCQVACKDEHVRQRLDAHRRAAAGHRALLDEGHRHRAGHGAQGASTLHA